MDMMLCSPRVVICFLKHPCGHAPDRSEHGTRYAYDSLTCKSRSCEQQWARRRRNGFDDVTDYVGLGVIAPVRTPLRHPADKLVIDIIQLAPSPTFSQAMLCQMKSFQRNMCPASQIFKISPQNQYRFIHHHLHHQARFNSYLSTIIGRASLFEYVFLCYSRRTLPAVCVRCKIYSKAKWTKFSNDSESGGIWLVQCWRGRWIQWWWFCEDIAKICDAGRIVISNGIIFQSIFNLAIGISEHACFSDPKS